MEKILLFIFLFLVQLSKSQSINSASHTGIDVTKGIISINSKSYYLEDIVTGCCSKGIYVACADASGHTLFRKNLNVNFDSFKKIIKTKDKGIIVIGNSPTTCDVAGSKDFIAKLDTNGNLLYRGSVSSAWSYEYISDIIEYQDSTLYMISDSLLIIYSKGGQYLSEIAHGLNTANSIFALANGHLLLNGKLNNALTNLEYDPVNFTVVSQQSTTFSLSKFEQSANGTILALSTSGELVSFNSNLGLISIGSGLVNSGIRISDFITRNDSLFVAGYVPTMEVPLYGILDLSFNVLSASQPSYRRVKPTGISMTNENKINVITTGASSVFSNFTFCGLYQFPIDGGFNSKSDIGIVAMNGINSTMSPSSYYYSLATNLDVVIKNFGADTVKSFYLNKYNTGGYCFNLFHKFYQVTIAPGSTINVQTGRSEFSTFYVEPGKPAPMNTKTEICLFTTVPNSGNDIEINNDAFCDSVLFTVTGIKENKLDDESVSVFPNPFHSSFHLQSAYKIIAIKLVNTLNVLLKDQLIENQETEFNYENLPNGIYFLKIETEKGTVLKKIVKD